MIVIADTTPLNYLVLIEQADVLRELYGRVLVPQAVLAELQSSDAPNVVRKWIAKTPEWVEVRQVTPILDAALRKLGSGESEAIALAQELHADAIIMDEKDGRQEAIQRNLRVIGTLRVLSDAAERGLLDLVKAFERLQMTSFRASQELYQRFLDLDEERRRGDASRVNR